MPVDEDSAEQERPGAVGQIETPRPTAAPLVLAAGLTLLAAGLLTSLAFTALGAALVVVGLAGWIRQLLPGAGITYEPLLPPEQRAGPVARSPRSVELLRPGLPGHRVRAPEAVHPYRAGLWGGAVGGALMAACALLYGSVSGRGIWYPVNLLAGMVVPSLQGASVTRLEQFDPLALLIGIGIHAVASLAVGFCLAVIMPILPRGQFIWGSLVAPLLWTGAIYGFMGILNPVMQARVDWPWFVASQFAYGIGSVLVILRSERVHVGPRRGASGS
jgi:hypothetical protein